jgi:O-antigen ligase
MQSESLPRPGQVVRRMSDHRRARPISGEARDVALRVSLGGIRLPLLLLIIITISRVHQYFNFLTPLRPALLLFAWAGVSLLMGAKGLAMANWRETPVRLVLALGVTATISAIFGISMGGSMSFILNGYWKVIATALMVAAAIRNEDDLWTMTWAYVIAIGILSFMTMTVFHMEAASDGGLSRLSDGYTYDANDIGLVCVTGIPLCLVTLRTSGKLGKLASIVILALACIAIARTGSRGAFLGIIAIAVSLLFTSGGISLFRRIVVAVVGALALAIAAPAGYMKQMGTITNPQDDYNFTSRTGRVEVAKRGIGYLQRNPLTGIGVMNFPRAEGTLSSAAQEFGEGGMGVKWSAAHNTFLQVTVETGLLGGTAFFALVGTGIASGRRLRKYRVHRGPQLGGRSMLIGTIASYMPITFIAFSVSAFFLSFAYMDPIYILAAIVAGSLGVARRMSLSVARTSPGLGTRRQRA